MASTAENVSNATRETAIGVSSQAPLKLGENANIISDVHEKFQQFKRVNLVDKMLIGGYSTSGNE